VALTRAHEGVRRYGGEPDGVEVDMEQGEQRKTLRCWVGAHRWVTRTNAGARWQECGRCGRYSKKVRVAHRFPPGGTGISAGGGF